MDWNEKLDALKELRKIGSDAQLASYLDVSRSFISQIRLKKSAMPISLAIRIADELGFEYTHDNVLSLMPSETEQVFRAKIENSALDEIKEAFGLNEVQLADHLGFPMSVIEKVRAGGRMPVKMRIALFDKNGYSLLRKAFLFPLPDKTKLAIKEFDNERLKKRLNGINSSRYQELFDKIDSILEYDNSDDVIDVVVGYIKEKKKVTGKD